MPELLTTFFADEYGRFMKGLDQLSETDAERLSKTTWRSVTDASKPRIVAVPQWDDVFHVRTRIPVTKEQKDRYWQNVRAKREQDLPPEITREIERRRAKLDAMRRSPQPEFDRAWGSVMTALDNVQDLLSSVSVLGRVAVTIGAKVGLRAIPGLGTVILAADALNLAMMLGRFAFPAWLLVCAGPRAALRAGVGSALTMQVFKRGSSLLARSFTGGVNMTARTAIRPRSVLGLIGSALVIGQTTDQLFGYGISLGPIVGGIMGAVYGADATTRGLKVEVRAGPSVEHIGPHVRDRLAAVPKYALLDRLRAAEVLASAPLLFAAESPTTPEDRLLAVMALTAAVPILRGDFDGSGWSPELDRLIEWPVPPPPHAYDPVSWRELASSGDNLPGQEWPSSWGAKGYMAPEAVEPVARSVRAGLEALLAHYRGRPEGAFIGAALNDVTEGLIQLYRDDVDAVRLTLSPAGTVIERMGAVGLLLHPGSDPARVEALWRDATEQVAHRAHALKTAAEWEKLFDKHQVDFVRMLGPEYSQS